MSPFFKDKEKVNLRVSSSVVSDSSDDLKETTMIGTTSAMVATTENIVGKVFAGRYEVVGPIGSGGMSSVFKAVDKRIKRAAAIKVLLPKYVADADAMRRFEQEAHVTDKGLVYLARFPSLETVMLSSSTITEVGCKNLANVPKLRSLSISLGIDETSKLINLARLKRLQRLNVYAYFPEAELRALQFQLPTLVVERRNKAWPDALSDLTE